ncbi:hypothetical protein FMJ36_05495 [Klebsiella michiganensis]|uniref:aquaporin n=1 Tax=Klebsiella michiganensis TaxID=1134687 RepID=UPI001CC98AB0|nr:aquaporin [Klebsiella michiganensis]MBZ7497471.1 hypothetical protein [Klebsiella michiganensis]
MNDSLKAQCTAEFLGTGLFLFFGIGCLSALKVAGASLGLWEICIIWGLGISLAVYLTSGISGGHLNPAVTVALWLFACFPGRKVFPYIVSQVAGAFGGAVLAFTWMAGWGDIAMTGGRDIPYFIVPIIAPLIGACLGAAIYRYLIGNNLPCNTCKLED